MWLTGFDVPSLATLYLDKSIDGFCPMGRWVVTRDEMGLLDELGCGRSSMASCGCRRSFRT
jgi:hypothetical protein